MRDYIKTQFNYTIKRFRCDNRKGEYDNTLFKSILTAGGISFEPSPAYTQHKNGVSERMIQTLKAKARAMLLDAQLPPPFWAEAINTACYLHRRSPSRSLGNKTPYEVLHLAMYQRDNPSIAIENYPSFHPPIDHLRRVGCVAWKVIPQEQRHDKKFGSRSRRCMMLGYVHHATNIWRLWDFETNSGKEAGRTFAWSDIVWEENINAFQISSTLASNELKFDVFPELLNENESGSLTDNSNLAPVTAPCNDNTTNVLQPT